MAPSHDDFGTIVFRFGPQRADAGKAGIGGETSRGSPLRDSRRRQKARRSKRPFRSAVAVLSRLFRDADRRTQNERLVPGLTSSADHQRTSDTKKMWKLRPNAEADPAPHDAG